MHRILFYDIIENYFERGVPAPRSASLNSVRLEKGVDGLQGVDERFVRRKPQGKG